MRPRSSRSVSSSVRCGGTWTRVIRPLTSKDTPAASGPMTRALGGTLEADRAALVIAADLDLVPVRIAEIQGISAPRRERRTVVNVCSRASCTPGPLVHRGAGVLAKAEVRSAARRGVAGAQEHELRLAHRQLGDVVGNVASGEPD